ncbi:MAG: hypothetical protein WBB01_07060 [Phormidesmis sp.]
MVNGAFQDSELGRGDSSEQKLHQPLHQPTITDVAEGQKPPAFHLAQQQIYDDLLESVRKRSPAEALADFEATFFNASTSSSPSVSLFFDKVLFANDEAEFRNTLKRACYIFVNNWDVARQGDMLHALLSLFQQPNFTKAAGSPATSSPKYARLSQWLSNFSNSSDFEELKLFAIQRIGPTQPGSWSTRYVAYQLIAQHVDEHNSLEQRAAARALSRRLKNKFKHDLAMYTAFSQDSVRLNHKYMNPTVLGDEVLRLIKTILMRRGRFSYRNIARLFQQQTYDSEYQDYKESLFDYLCFSISQPEVLTLLETDLAGKLPQLYREDSAKATDPSLRLRTCNRLIDHLTTEDRQHPSELFVQLLSLGNPLNVVILLLKIVLISPNSQLYVEARLADLISYYKPFMEAECRSIIQFLEICSVTFAIYSDNVEYNLVKVSAKQSGPQKRLAPADTLRAPDAMAEFRIFSQSFRAAQKRSKLAFEQPDS